MFQNIPLRNRELQVSFSFSHPRLEYSGTREPVSSMMTNISQITGILRAFGI
jgi:hypothetical protein